MAERVAENLNRALHELFATTPNLYLLGEDVLDPYGGAFKITRGLSSQYADRVLTTPLSENGIVGVANGLALCGNKVIVEMMFGDFLLLALDQLVNFAAKSVTMFGQPVALPVVVRCPVGGQRGYGATHSQSVHKFVVGVPGLELWEMSPFVSATQILAGALARSRPAVLFEDKVLYTKRMFEHGVAGTEWVYENTGDPVWTVARPRAPAGGPGVAIIGAGGVAHRCLAAAGTLHTEHRVAAEVFVPARLQPCDPAPVLDRIAAAGCVVIVEEGTPDGSWSGVLAQRLHTELWGTLTAPVALVSSRASIIPAAAHLEQRILVSAEDVISGALGLCARPGRSAAVTSAPGADPVPAAPAASSPGPARAPAATPVVVPQFNSNDDSAVLLEWLVADGATVTEGQPLAVLETSKSAADLEAPASGVITQHAPVGGDYAFGHVIATIGGQPSPQAATVATVARDQPHPAGLPISTPPGRRRARAIQEAVAAATATAHRTIPPAFAWREVPVDLALDHLDRLAGQDGPVIDLAPLLLAAVAALHPRHRELFATVDTGGAAAATSCADVGVTVDVGTGLFLPVVRAGARSLDDIADRLIELQMAAVAGELADRDLDLSGVGLGVSLNLSSGADVVQPLIMPGMSCMVSIGAVRNAIRAGAGGAPASARVVTIGIAHDHRVVNGAPAMRFLSDLAELLQRPAEISDPPAVPGFIGDCTKEVLLPMCPLACFQAGRFTSIQSSWTALPVPANGCLVTRSRWPAFFRIAKNPS